MDLSNYYSRFDYFQLMISILFIFSGDVIGTYISSKLKAPVFTRPFWWIVGIMTYVNIWFLLSPFMGFSKINLLLLFVVTMVPVLPIYLIKKDYLSLLVSLRSNILSLLFLVPLLIPLWVKLSLPPYFADEISYHYYSPIEVSRPELTERIHNLYYYLPQSLDNLYRLTFSITKSYATARLLHLLIVVSCLLVTGAWINKKLGSIPYILWSIFSWYMAANFVSMSTNGLVDMGTAGLVLVTICLMIDAIDKNRNHLLFLSVICGMAVSFKYSALIPIVGYGTIYFFQSILNQKVSLNKALDLSFKSLALFIAFGGFWLIRNFILTGKFIYGIKTNNFFSGWTIPLWPLDVYRVSKELFTGNYYFVIPFTIGLLILVWQHRYVPKILTFLILGWLIELIIVQKLGGFIIRYYFHWIYTSLIVMLGVFSVFKNQKLIVSVYTTALAIFLTINAVHVVKFVYGSEFTPDKEWAYAKGEIKIDDWIRQSLGEQYELTKWCGSRKTSEITSLYIADPNIIWVTRNGDFQGFLVNCRSVILDLGYDREISIPENQSYVYVVSVSDCVNTDQIMNLLYVDKNDPNWVELEQYPYAIKQRTMNNDLVCSGIEIIKNLYRINRKDFNNIVNSYSSK